MTEFTQSRLNRFVKALEESPVDRNIGVVDFWVHNFSDEAQLCINMCGSPNDLFRAFCLWFGADILTTNFLMQLYKQSELKNYFICEFETFLISTV